MLDVGCWMSNVGCGKWDVECGMLDVGSGMSDVGCQMLDVSIMKSGVRQNESQTDQINLKFQQQYSVACKFIY